MTFAFHDVRYGGRYGVRLANGPADRAACGALRHQRFFGGQGQDSDPFDAACAHLMIADGGHLVATARLRVFGPGADLGASYAGARYDLTRLGAQAGAKLEIGRLCTAQTDPNPDILRLLWGAVAQVIASEKVRFVFGCSSFSGLNSEHYTAAFAHLARKARAPAHLAPGVATQEIVPLDPTPDTKGALAQIPPLLRSYLMLGGWVSDHAVIDRALGTLHVLTGLEVDKVPPRRAKGLLEILG